MAIQISSVSVSPNRVNTGETITVTIVANEVTWDIVKKDFSSWEEIETKLANWKALLNYH